MPGVTLRWPSIPAGGSRSTGEKRGPDGALGLFAHATLPDLPAYVEIMTKDVSIGSPGSVSLRRFLSAPLKFSGNVNVNTCQTDQDQS